MPGLVLFVAVGLSTGFAPLPFGKPKLPLLDAMQGTWELTRESDIGRGSWAKDTRIFVRVRGKTWMYLFRSGVSESEGTPSEITLGTRHGLGTIDLNLMAAADGRNVLRGIIKVEGDLMTVCHSPETGERPGALAGWKGKKDGKPVPGQTMTFKKVK